MHYCKVLLDSIFGRECFLNEIIWAYDYGGRRARTLAGQARQHPRLRQGPGRLLLSTTKRSTAIPYMAPGLVGAEKAARGKLPTDTWWHTIVPTNGKEKTGYPTQKPLGILQRIVQASSRPGDVVLDFFAGSGTTGAVCLLRSGREFILVDNNPQAIEVMRRRFVGIADIEWRITEYLTKDEGRKTTACPAVPGKDE